MDTKWKNIDKKAKKFFGEYYKLMAEVLLAAMGITLLVITVVYRDTILQEMHCFMVCWGICCWEPAYGQDCMIC